MNNIRGFKASIPPIYTEWLGHQLYEDLILFSYQKEILQKMGFISTPKEEENTFFNTQIGPVRL